MSTDDTVKIAKYFGAKIVKNKKLTVGPGRNEGFKIAGGELIAFSDDDCVMDRDWLFNSVKYFKDEQVGGLSGPTITKNEGGHLSEAIGLVFELAAGTGVSAHRSDIKQVEEVEDIPGCNAIYRRKALEKVFPIDEGLITAEDVEMNRLIRQSGFKLIFVPDVKLWHYRRQNIFGFFKQMYRFAVGRLQVGRKNLRTLKLTHVLVGITLPFLILSFLAFNLLHIKSIYYYTGIICLLIAVGSIYGFFKTGSIRTALCFPLVVMTLMVAWSLGFTRELLFSKAFSYRRKNV
jgi:GT2 family glycosyltransferase